MASLLRAVSHTRPAATRMMAQGVTNALHNRTFLTKITKVFQEKPILHGTSDKACEKPLQTGVFEKRSEVNPYLWGTDDPKLAEAHAKKTAAQTGGKPCIVHLKVDSKDRNKTVYPDWGKHSHPAYDLGQVSVGVKTVEWLKD